MERITQLYRIEVKEFQDWRKLVEAICRARDHVSLYHLFLASNPSGVSITAFHPGMNFDECRVDPIIVDNRELGFRLEVLGEIANRKVMYCVDAYYDGEGLTITPCPESPEESYDEQTQDYHQDAQGY